MLPKPRGTESVVGVGWGERLLCSVGRALILPLILHILESGAEVQPCQPTLVPLPLHNEIIFEIYFIDCAITIVPFHNERI